MENFIKAVRPYTKSIIAGIVGVLQVLSLYIVLNNDGSFSAEDQTAIINAVIIAITGTGAVYQLPNTKAKGVK